jgi:probable rRNA maturation factor
MTNKTNVNFEIIDKSKAGEINGFIESVLNKGFFFLIKKNLLKKNCRIDLSVALLKEEEIRKLNKEYRKINKPTDILSFCYNKNKDFLEGELILCLSVIQMNAKEDKKYFEEELSLVIFHGILHLLGFSHSQEMFSLQNEFVGQLKFEK